jgi:putative membrane protein
MHDGGMGWWMLWGGGMMIIFWGLVIGLIVWGVSRLTGERRRDEQLQRGEGAPRDEQAPMDVARSRYARGEISRDEFTQIRRDLEAV